MSARRREPAGESPPERDRDSERAAPYNIGMRRPTASLKAPERGFPTRLDEPAPECGTHLIRKGSIPMSQTEKVAALPPAQQKAFRKYIKKQYPENFITAADRERALIIVNLLNVFDDDA